MSYRICLIEGDGIGHEVIPAARQILGSLQMPFTFVEAQAGWATFERLGTALPEATLTAVREADATLFGAVSSPVHRVDGYRSPIVAMRRELGLYANLRPVISQPVPSSRPNIDMLIVRENSEGLYAGIEHSEAGRAVTERVITAKGSERIARTAYELARTRRRKVTIVHKANVLRATCGLFRETALNVAQEYPNVQTSELLVDTAAMRLITHPEGFDVIVTTNLFGDILSDEAAALVGGLGLAPSGNVGLERGIFEPVHGSAPDIAGQGIANPLASFRAAAMMMAHLGEASTADRIDRAVDTVLENGDLTPDLGGNATTARVTAAVIREISEV